MEAPPSIGHKQAVDFVVVGSEGNKKKFLVLEDMLSSYSEVFCFILPPTSAPIISKLSDFWNALDWLVVFCSDGKQNLAWAEFDEFLADNGITSHKLFDGYPQSNGSAERAVQIG